MPQQINLRTPILLTQKHYFSASTMAGSLAVIAAFSAALYGYWMWSLSNNSAELNRTLTSFSQERQRLQAALKDRQASQVPAEAGLQQALQAQQGLLQQREQVLAELGRGLLREGQGHATRLRLVAQTIPPEVWVTEVKADERQMEVTGFTLDPAALNHWVARLAEHPLLRGHVLSAVKVERVVGEAADAGGRTAGAPTAAASRPRWAFVLVSTAPGAPLAAAPAGGAR